MTEMTELQYETTPDAVRVYPVMDDDFSTLEHAEVNEEAWEAHISTAGEIKLLIDPDGKEYTAFEELKELGIESLKVVCKHHVELDDFL